MMEINPYIKNCISTTKKVFVVLFFKKEIFGS